MLTPFLFSWNNIICHEVQNIDMAESNIEKYLGIIDLNQTAFTNEEILEIIDLYLKQKPYLEGTSVNEDVVIFKFSSDDDLIEEDDIFIDEPCFDDIHDQHYMQNWHNLQNKYGKNSSVDLSKEKLDFREVITVFTFIERANRHAGQGSAHDIETWSNLLSRLEEIKNELKH